MTVSSSFYYSSGRVCRFLLFLTVNLSIVGCGTTSDQSDTREHPDDHHNEHFVPDHKPVNFAEAVDQLSRRSSHLASHDTLDDAHSQEELQELRDIVGWLPELAADSDLNEADWNAVHQQSMEMLKQSSGLQLVNDAGLLAESLRKFVPRAGKPEPAILAHDHDHDHDHDHKADELKQESPK